MIKVIDNFLPIMYANQIEYELETELMYKYKQKTSSPDEYGDVSFVIDENSKDYGQFVCTLLNSSYTDESKFKDYFERLKAVVFTAGEHIEKDICSVDRVKVNLLLQQPTALESHYNFAHTDDKTGSHYSMVYYVNDSDGDTFLFNEFWDPELGPPNQLTLNQRVSPKRNRAVIFESDRFHASSNPQKHATRFVINFVMKVV